MSRVRLEAQATKTSRELIRGSARDETTLRRGHKWHATRRREAFWGYVFISPFIAIFGAFVVYPNVVSVKLSFQSYSGFGVAEWVGFSNYTQLLRYPVFWTELRNTVFYWLIHAVILIPLAFVLALLVRSKAIRAKGMWRGLIFLPQVVSIVAIALTFRVLFATQSGVINALIGTKIAWLEDYTIARWVVVLLLVWEGLGFWFVVFLVGLSTVDPHLEEAASLDGAGPIRICWSIIIPSLRPLILFAFIIDAISSIALYTEPNVLAGGRSNNIADPAVATVSNLVVTNLQGASFGVSSAAGWLLFLFTVFVTGLIFVAYRMVGGDPVGRA